MKKNLIYSVTGAQTDYYKLFEFCIQTIKDCSNVDNIEFMILCDKEYYKNIEHLEGVTIKITGDNQFDWQTSMRKVEIFNYININDYNNILYLDGDIVVTSDINEILEQDLKSDILYLVDETHMLWYSDPPINDYVTNIKYKSLYYSLCKHNEEELNYLISNNVKVFNCGHFLFKSSEHIKSDFNAVLDMIKNHKGAFFWEQSFMSHYFNLKGNTNFKLLADVTLLLPKEYRADKKIIHFTGVKNKTSDKLYKMNEWYNKTLENRKNGI